MPTETAEIRPIDPLAHRAAILRVYCDALGFDPRADGATAWVDAFLPLHTGMPDFAFRAAVDADGAIVGFAFGHTGAYGQWWADRIAADMPADVRRVWLDPPHFEVVELHVRPRVQRTGIGTRLLDALLASQPHERALLSTNPGSRTAVPFYRKHGWQLVSTWRRKTGDKLVLGKAGLK